jgi:hypothetical protein
MERNEFIKQCEELIDVFEHDLHREATKENPDRIAFARLAEGYRLAQEHWLLAARGMSPEKARAVMVGFALNELTKWMNERRPGPPPSVLTLYPDGPISDEQFGRSPAIRVVEKPEEGR